MSPRPRAERRQNRPLREVLDDLLGHAREIARRAKEMTPAELDYAQQRLEWLADEVWRGAPPPTPPGKGGPAPPPAPGGDGTPRGFGRGPHFPGPRSNFPSDTRPPPPFPPFTTVPPIR